MKAKFSINPFWDARVMDAKTKESRVLLSVNLNGVVFRLSLRIRCTKAEFQSAVNTRSNASKELRNQIQEYVDKAELILNKLTNPDKDSFTRLFKSDSGLITASDKIDVFAFYDLKIEEAKNEGRISTMKSYIDNKRALRLYSNSVCFENVDERWLKLYQAYMISKGNSPSTISIRLRCLRAVFNLAIAQGFISEKCYPFKKLSVGSSKKSKNVLYPEQIKALWNCETVGIREGRAKAYFFFTFLCNGMNFHDMVHLKYRNIKGDLLTFIRSKTKNTSAEVNEIQVHLTQEAKQIIEQWGNKEKSLDNYIFPVLNKCKNAKHMDETKFRVKRVCNKMLKRIGEKLNIDTPITMHIARHSFATTLKLNGTNVAFISEMLGHTNVKTTMHYMKQLPSEQLKQISNSLMNFNVVDDNSGSMLRAV